MKLIIREYLASLREREELDALLPDLLSQMGLVVFSKPGIGNRQYGVDVAAFGSIDGQPEKVYLFSIKSGNLGRKDWNSGSPQDLQPSLDDIRDTYIPTHLPVKYKNKPIEICICFGGDIKEEIRLSVSSYQDKYRTHQITFSEWGGEELAMYIEKFFLREELLPDSCRRLLRKSLAMLDESEIGLKHFYKLISLLSSSDVKQSKKVLTALRQLNICLWILYSWCREADNLESAFLGSERTLLYAWSISKGYFEKKDKTSKAIQEAFTNIIFLKMQIGTTFLDTKILPHANKLHALSSAVSPSSSVDVNLKSFDILGRLALEGLWLHWYVVRLNELDNNHTNSQAILKKTEMYRLSLKQLITNNPILFTPYKDDQAIDINLTALFFALDPQSHEDLHRWLLYMMEQINFLFQTNSLYPCNLYAYHELLEHPQDRQDYREEVTKGSILYPTIATYAALFEFDDVYAKVQQIKSKFLEHCNFQIWYPDETSENHFYKFDENHGGTLSHVCVDKEQNIFLEEIFKECNESEHFNQLSAIQYQTWPIILTACRHYSFPIPLHFLSGFRVNTK
jgi:hypothetical protein